MNERVLVTGADGFIGSFVCRKLLESGYTPHAGVRCLDKWPELQRLAPGLTDYSALGDLAANQSLQAHLKGISAVVHLAGRTSAPDNKAKSMQECRHTNVDGTMSIASAAAAAGVRRFVFVSTVKVHGESTTDRPFTEDSPADPQNPYAASKWEAEEMLRDLAQMTGIECVIARPPQVYGPGVRGNFLRLMQLVDRSWPLPVPRKRNGRSLIGADNLADFLVCCINHPQAPGQSFLVKDCEDLSTYELISRLGRLLGHPARTMALPESLIRLAAKLTRKEEEADKVFGSLEVSSSRAQEILGWKPPVSLDDGLAATARWFRKTKNPERAN